MGGEGIWLLFGGGGGGQEVQNRRGALKPASLFWPPAKGRAGIACAKQGTAWHLAHSSEAEAGSTLLPSVSVVVGEVKRRQAALKC